MVWTSPQTGKWLEIPSLEAEWVFRTQHFHWPVQNMHNKLFQSKTYGFSSKIYIIVSFRFGEYHLFQTLSANRTKKYMYAYSWTIYLLVQFKYTHITGSGFLTYTPMRKNTVNQITVPFSFAFSLANSIHFQSYLSQGILVTWFHAFVI